jgi:small-conductance mechanosensitive channel
MHFSSCDFKDTFMQVKRLLFFLLFHSFYMHPVELGNKLKEEILAPKVRIFVGLDVTARHKNVENLKTELVQIEHELKDFNSSYDQKQVDFAQQIVDLQDMIVSKNVMLVQKKIQMLHQLAHVWTQIKETKEKIIELLSAHIEFWEKYFSQSTHQSNLLVEKSLYTFLDFQNMTTKLFLQQEQFEQLVLQKEAQNILISKEEHLISSKEKELVRICDLITEKKKQNDINKDDILQLDLEKELAGKEKELAALQLSLYQKQIEFLSSKEMVVQERINLLQEQSEKLRSRLYIDISDVEKYEQKHTEQRQICDTKKTEFTALRQDVASKKMQAQEELDRLRLRFKIKMNSLKNIEDAEFQAHAMSENFAIFTVAQAYSIVVTYDRMLLKIKIEMLEQEVRLKQAQIVSDTVKLLYEISQGLVKDSQTFEKERVLYKQMRQSMSGDIKNFKDEVVVLQNQVKELQRILVHITSLQETAKNTIPTGSGSMHKKWAETIISLEQILKQLQEQHEIMLQNGEIYEKIIAIDEETLECIDTILHEFNAIGVWHRSMSAVTWEGIKNIAPNFIIFLKGLYSIVMTYLSQITLHKIAYTLSTLGIGGILTIFFLLFLVFFLYLLLQAALPSVYKNLISVQGGQSDPLYKSRQVFAIVVGFLIEVFKPLYFWSLFLCYEFLCDVAIALLIIFYLYSIVFWIWASQKILAHFILINRKFDYTLLSKRLIERFSSIFSFFAISTIVILVMRKMFMVVMLHQQTELPNILLRIYHVVIFISIIFSLDKEELLQWLPKKSAFGQKFAQIFARHYYLFLLGFFGLLVLSDPYLGGYGTLMWHVCWNLFLTACVLGSLFILHTLIKQYTTVFFYGPSDHVGGVSERFDYAKTWYAIYVIGLMFLFLIVAVVACAHVWGYGFTYGTLRKIVMYELVRFETLNSMGKVIPESFKFLNLLYIILMTCVGILLAFVFKKLILQRVFDIQYVDPGIQNTVTIISRYVIIIAAVMIACIQSKLGFVVTYVSFVGLATFGWSFKDLFTDFVAYFFILVQRPLKLGDYVKIDEETMGVVRRISPRAVILRRRNSVNIVVPNSTVLKASLYNWNYARNYIGFDDIIFCVPFGTDIALVREICFKVLQDDNDVLKVPQPFVRLQDFDDKGYVFMVRGFLSSGNTLRQWDIASNIRFALVLQLAKAGIAIAGPNMKILIRKEQEI